MVFCDTHCDFLANSRKRSDQSSIRLYRESDIVVQVFAIYISPDIKNPIIKTLRQLILYRSLFFRPKIFTGNIERAAGWTKRNAEKTRIFPILALEGMKPANYSLFGLKALRMAGTKSVSLTWNEDNEFAGGAESDGELKEKGRKALRYIEEKNLILDVSHLNEKSFYQALEYFDGPVMASHSSCKGLFDCSRNISDKQIKRIIDRNGFIGINIFPDFLVGEGSDATSKDVARHIDYVCKLGGINNVGLGSDFSGIDRTPTDMENCTTFYRVAENLAKMNYSEENIKKICYSNFFDFIIQFV